MPKISTVFAVLVIAAAILLSAWHGNANWLTIALFAVIMKLPGTGWIKKLFNKEPKCRG